MVKELQRIDEKAADERKLTIVGVQWVNATRKWFEKNRAQTFDLLRNLDTDADGILSGEQFAEGLKKMQIALDEEELETLVVAVDFESDNKIRYCEPPQLLKCYGGSLQELVNNGLERVMLNHRQDIAEIEERRVEQAELVKNKYGSGGAAAAEGADDAAKTEEAAA